MDQVVAPKLPTTPKEYLAWQPKQEIRYEFDGRQPIPMNGGTVAHVTIEANIVGELRSRLRGSAYRASGGNMKVAIGPVFRYPDASVSPAPVDMRPVFVTTPAVLFEIVSPGSRRTDEIVKLAEYRSLPSVQRYVLVEQREVRLTVHVRGEDGWTVGRLGAGEVLRMPEIGVDLPVDEVYEGVFPAS